MKLGKITIKVPKKAIIKANKKASRECELENSTGWKAKHKVHKTVKDYKRSPKHKKTYSDFE